jgi:hypothetical protein
MLLLIIAIAFPQGARCQDLIVVNGRDSVNCKIRATDARGIHYDHLYKGGLQRAYVLHSAVSYKEKRFYDERYNGEKRMRDRRGQVLRLSWQGGMGWFPGTFLGRMPEWYQDHLKGLRIGGLQRLDLHFMLLENWGMGACLGDLYTRHTSHDVMYQTPDGSLISGMLQDDIRLFSYGVSTFYQLQFNDTRIWFLAFGSFEMIRYRNNVIMQEPVERTGRAYGGRLGMGSEYRFQSGIGAGLSAHYALTNRDRADKLIRSAHALALDRRWDLVLAISLSY